MDKENVVCVWAQRTDAFDCGAGETVEHPLDCKEIKPVNPKGSQFNGHGFEQTPGESGVLQSMSLQRVTHDLVTKQQQQIYIFNCVKSRNSVFCNNVCMWILNVLC